MEAMTEAAVDHRATAGNALSRAARLHEQLAAAKNALRSLGLAYADLKTDNDDLAAENARQRSKLADLTPLTDAADEWRRHYGNTSDAFAEACARLVAAVDALPNMQEPCPVCSSTGGGCPDCRPDGLRVESVNV